MAAVQDMRCSIRAKSSGADIVFGSASDTENVMRPLRLVKRLVFPYTPTVQTGSAAEYDDYSVMQSAFKYPSFIKSYPKEIVVSGDFTAQTMTEAKYVLAVMQFFKSIVKPYFGATDPRAGTPPAVVLFNYLGRHQFNDVPVVVKDYSYTLEPDADYVYISDFDSYVPTKLNISITLDTYFNPKVIRDEFNLDDFKTGKLYNKGFL